jgi:hypothetical protein
MTNYQKARDWMHLASLELRTALATFRMDDFIACIQHCQQSLERALKSLLAALDAFDEGILLYDRDGFLSESRKKLVEELTEKDVVKTDRWWSFPVKAGEEYTY